MEHEFNLNSPGVYVIKQARGLDEQPPQKVDIVGLIGCPAEFIEKREIDKTVSYITFSKQSKKIVLVVNESSFYATRITGMLKIHPKLLNWGINESKDYNTHELADKIKMNRHYFASQAVAMKLVTELKNFKAKVDKQIELSNNNRGNMKAAVEQVAETNIPESFTLSLPVFDGQPNVDVVVEIYINPTTLTCSLVSPELEAYIESQTEAIIGEQIDKIKSAAPQLSIFEI